MDENPDINPNIDNLEQNSNLNNEILDEMNIQKELDDEEEKNEALIQDLIKQGKYFDVIKYLESKDNNDKLIKNNLNNDNDIINNKDNNEEEELVIIPADDISDLHENINNIIDEKDKNEEILEKNEVKKNIDINNNDIKDDNTNKENEIKNEDNLDKKIQEDLISKEKKEIKNDEFSDNNNIIGEEKNENINKNTEQNIINNIDKNKEEENISPKELIKNIIASDNNKTKKSQSLSNNSSKSISLLHLSFEEEQENNNYYEERLKEIQEERKNFLEQNIININPNGDNGVNTTDNNIKVMNNLELLTKELAELNELENNENEDLNDIEQMNEMYQMLQEDKKGKYLQEKRRERLFPFYQKANCDIKKEIKNEYFKSSNLNNIRNFFISSKILDNKSILKRKNYNNNKYNIELPKSVFDELKFDKSDIKELDYEEYLDDFLEDKNNNKNNKLIKNNNSRIEKIFKNFREKYKNKNKKEINELNNKNINKNISNNKPKEIFLNNNKKNNSINKEQYEINLKEIYNKYKDSVEVLDNNKSKYDLKKFNNFYVDNFNNKNEILNLNDYSIDLDLDEDLKKEIIDNNKNGQNNLEDKDKENYYLKINNSKSFNEMILNNYSYLRFINLENNNLSKFPDLTKCRGIYSINLNNNKIQKIEAINNLIHLEKLSLTNNLISSIDNCFINNKRLRFLYLGHNKISSIDNISNDLPFIEELIICQNNINFLPEKIFLPYLKFFDLNENKITIKNSDNPRQLFFICPALEKLLLLGNNLSEEGTQFLIKYCPRLKEIDLSFNKYNNMVSLVELFSVNSGWNNNLEMINVVGNTFFNSNKNKEMFYFLIKKFCPSIKYINNDEIKKNNKIFNNNDIISQLYNNNDYNKIINCNLNEGYINIFNSENLFMKYFTSVYFTNKIFDTYNININNNLKTNNVELFSLINQTYYQFKLSHFISQININNNKIGFFSFESEFQFSDLLVYLYKFKSKMNYIRYSIPILVKRTLFRRMKIIKIQQHYKLRILRKKLAAIVIPDDEDDHAEDLLDFFNSENKEKEEVKFDDEDLDKKIEEIGKKIEKNIENKNILKNKSKAKNNFLEVIKEEEKERDIDIQLGINLDKIPDLDIDDNDIKDIKEIKNDIEKSEVYNNNKNNKNIAKSQNEIKTEKIKETNNMINNNNKILNNINSKKEIIPINKENNKEKEKDSLVLRLLSNPKYSTNGNSKLNPIRLTPITNTTKIPFNQPSSNIKINNKNPNNNINAIINNNYNAQNIDNLKRGLGLDPNINKNSFYSDKSSIKPPYPQGHKKILKDEKYYGYYVDMNAQSNLPLNKKNEKHTGMKRPESKGVVLPQINNNLNMSTTTLSNDTKSVYSQITGGKKMLKVNHKGYKSKPMEILMLEQECKEAIEKAKAEWAFTNKEIEAMLVRKIKKKYEKKRLRLLEGKLNI